MPAPLLVLQTLVADWSLLTQSLLVTLVTTFEGFLLAAAGGVGLAVLFSQSRLVEYSLYPYAVILQVTPIVAHRAAAVDLPAAARGGFGLRLDRGVLPGARQYDARAAFGRSQSHRSLLAVRRFRAAKCSGASNCRRRCPICLAACVSPAGLSLIGAVVAEIAAGSAGAGSGLAYRMAKSGYRLNIPRMFAALLLLSVAGIAIFYF